MTKSNNNSSEKSTENFNKLSIQVSLNGLSFCIADTLRNTILLSDQVNFGKELSPYEVQRELKELFNEHDISGLKIAETVVVHRNNLFSLVPKALFDKNELANYLKFNAKILANDLIEYDEIESHDIVIVYVPYININNYVFDLFGEFEFVHNGTVLLQSLLKSAGTSSEPVCYIHAGHKQMDMIVLSRKQLHFYNSFNFNTKEDFIYYILFTLEQLDLDPESVPVRLFGKLEEGDELYSICHEFIRHISLYEQDSDFHPAEEMKDEMVDFTVLNAL
ncbi:MAG: DUF3822 family protein [Flavobacteriaceae bacterium]